MVEHQRSRPRRGGPRRNAGNGQRPQEKRLPDADDLVVRPDETLEDRTGLLELRSDGYGLLRTDGYLPGPDDVSVARSEIQRLGLRTGDKLTGRVRPAKQQGRTGAMVVIDTVSDLPADELGVRPRFDELPTPSPDERLRLEHDPREPIGRIIDLLAPVGKGQRGMIVAPPKAGKTTILKRIADGIVANHPDVQLFVLLVDERPEEAHDWRKTVPGADVVASTFDKAVADHTSVSELLLERAKRMVEHGRDVVILLDSLTRMTRSYNQTGRSNGRTLSGGIDQTALEGAKRFFGSARNIDGAGSLTILATCLVETGSRMDDVIFEEFKGRGNMEVRLDRGLAEQRLFPAITASGSGTRNEELLFTPDELTAVWRLRRVLQSLSPSEAIQVLLKNISTTETNAAFLERVAQVA